MKGKCPFCGQIVRRTTFISPKGMRVIIPPHYIKKTLTKCEASDILWSCVLKPNEHIEINIEFIGEEL